MPKTYTTVTGVIVEATEIPTDLHLFNATTTGGYFIKFIDNKGAAGEQFYIQEKLFKLLFERRYSSLQEYIDDNRDKYPEQTLNVLADNWEN